MSIRPLPAGQEGKITWGVLGKRQTYTNKAFKSVPDLTTEEKRQELLNKMKPYNSMDYIGRTIFVVGGSGEAPTPPVETFYLQTAQGDNLQTAQGDNILWYIEPVPVDPDAQTYLDDIVSAGGVIDATIVAATSNLFTDLKSNGLYSKLDTLYLMLGGTAASTALNGIRTNSSFDITWVNSGSMTFNYSGATGDGSTAYGNTNYNPRNESSATDTSWGIYHTLDNFGGNNGEIYSFGAFDGTYLNNHYYRPNINQIDLYGYTTNFALIGTPSNVSGSYISTITGGTKALYHNLNSISSLSGSATPSGSAFLTNQPYYLFTLNINGSPYAGNYYNGRIQHFFNGSYLTPAETETMMGLLNTFETSLGRKLY